MKKTLTLLLLASGLLGSLAYALAPQGPLHDERGATAESEALLRALDSIQTGNIRADLHFVAADEMAGRDTPSSGLRKAARFIRARLERLRFQPAGTDGSFFHEYELELPSRGDESEEDEGDGEEVDEGPVIVENVCGLWPGSDPVLAREVVIVSAHYDHVGEHDGEIYNGADDNGSGTCGLLAIAEALAQHGPMKRSVLLLWVSGEEKGLLGSMAWSKDPTLPEGMEPVAALNIDMIGRNAPDYLLITPTSAHDAYNGLTRVAEAHAPFEGFEELGSCDDYWYRSDHMSFHVNLEIPVAFLFSNVHEDYHQPSDTVEKIDYDKIRRVSRLVVRMLDALQEMDLEDL
jgi:hypothetical protein